MSKKEGKNFFRRMEVPEKERQPDPGKIGWSGPVPYLLAGGRRGRDELLRADIVMAEALEFAPHGPTPISDAIVAATTEPEAPAPAPSMNVAVDRGSIARLRRQEQARQEQERRVDAAVLRREATVDDASSTRVEGEPPALP